MKYFWTPAFNNKPVLLTIGLVITGLSLFAQNVAITGKVIDGETKLPIEGAIIKVIRATDKHIFYFAQTDANGVFNFKNRPETNDLNLEVSLIGYAGQTKEITKNQSSFIVELVKKEIQLKDVIIKPPKIGQRGDTIRYEVSAFSAASDRTIGDVLKKIPGIEVLESGEIKYQGQKLNKFYVDGSDLLGGRYGLATNNISYQNVASVEIMENHQPIKMLEDVVFSSQPALNIKLKEDARSRWTGTIKGGGGVTDLWNTEAFGMRFAKKVQSLSTFKANNIGSINNDYTQFSSIGDGLSATLNNLPSYIQVTPSSPSGIGISRSRFDIQKNITTNDLIKLGNDYELLPEISFLNSHRSSAYSASKTYYLGNGQQVVEQNAENAENYQKTLNGKIELKTNQKTQYLDNVLKINADWMDTDIGTTGTYPNIQNSNTKNKLISNDFSLMKSFGRKIVTIQSVNRYETKPQDLLVTKAGSNPIMQNIDLSSFYSKTGVQYGLLIGKLFFNTNTYFQYQTRKIANTLDTIANETNPKNVKLSFSPSFEYSFKDYHISLNAPVAYQNFSINNQNHAFLNINPSLSFTWILSPKVTVFTNGSVITAMPDDNLFYNGNILTNYRNINSGYVDFATGKLVNASSGIRYKDVLNLFFADATVTLSNTEQNKITDQTFTGDFIVNNFMPGNVNANNLTVNTSFSKGVEWLKGIVALYPSATFGTTSLTRNGVAIPYNNTAYNLKGKISSKAFKWCNINYDFLYGINSFKIQGGTGNTRDQFSETATADFFIYKFLQTKFIFEHYYNEISDNQHQNFVFSDISMSYLHKRWEYSILVKNILDQRSYAYITESNLNTEKYNYKIRPRDILLNVTYRF